MARLKRLKADDNIAGGEVERHPSEGRDERNTGLVRYVVLAAISICFLTGGAAEAHTGPVHNVLVLNSYHHGYYWSDNIMDAIQTEFDKSDLNVEFFFEYLDTRRYRSKDIFPYLKELYRSKYNSIKFDVIISSDNGAFDFLLEHRGDLFPGVPVVFCGVQGFEDSLLKGQDSMTGVLEEYDYAATLEIALKLHGSTRRAAVITENEPTTFAYRDKLTEVIRRSGREIELVIFSLWELKMAELLEKTEKLGDESVVLLVSAFKDREGKFYGLRDSMAMIRQHCAAPIYVTSFQWLGLGPVGGKLNNGSYQGQAAANMAIQILKGKNPQEIPILRESPNAYMFDYNQLKHFGISLSRLPSGSIVVNEPESFYYRYKTLIWIVSGIIAALTTIVIVLSANILRRKKAEQELKESEQRFRVIFDNAADGILLADVETKKLYTGNKVICEMLGRDAEEIKNLTAMDIHPKEELDYVMEQFEKQARKEGPLAEDIQVKRKDGSVFYADINSFPITLSGKTYLMGIFRDISERRKMEEDLRESEEKYRSLIENIGIGVVLISPKMEILAINREQRRWFPNIDVSKRPVCYKTFNDPPREGICPYCPLYKSLQDGQVHESITETPAGDKIINYRIIASPIKDKDGRVVAAIEMVEDITERRQRKEELDMYRERMARAEQLASLGTLSATLAHELTQPLTVIRLTIENLLAELKETSCPETVREELKDGLSSVENAATIVDRFRNFARKSSERAFCETDLGAAVEKIVELLNEIAKRAKMTVIVKNMRRLPRVWANQQDMEQFFFAMIQNAMQAADGKRNRRLTISGVKKDEHIELRFADNCGGIAPENIDRIFQPFFTTSTNGTRTGLGLCIVQRILSECGGKIRVESKFGKGTTFHITLPVYSSGIG